jgi:hypothetical protein
LSALKLVGCNLERVPVAALAAAAAAAAASASTRGDAEVERQPEQQQRRRRQQQQCPNLTARALKKLAPGALEGIGVGGPGLGMQALDLTCNPLRSKGLEPLRVLRGLWELCLRQCGVSRLPSWVWSSLEVRLPEEWKGLKATSLYH